MKRAGGLRMEAQEAVWRPGNLPLGRGQVTDQWTQTGGIHGNDHRH
jgi:hypothetical protein